MKPALILERAIARRRPHLEARPELDVYRLLNGPEDGAPPGLTLDRYADWQVLCARQSVPDSVVEAWVAGLEPQLESGLVVKRLAEDPTKSVSRVAAGVLTGPVVVHEHDACLLTALDDGLSTGLFIDQREVRFRARALGGARVLNLFSYCCSFSVHVALAGAEQVTSVDVSKRALARGRASMEASGLDPNGHRWFADEVMTHIARAGRRKDRYDLVVCDPPAYGHGRAKTFTLDRDFESLTQGALDLVADGGALIMATHTEAIGWKRLEAAVHVAAQVSSRALIKLERMGLPWDHPAEDESADRGDYLRVLVAHLGSA